MIGVKLFFGFDILLVVFAFDFEERRFRNINVTGFDQFRHLTVEECQKQSPDVRPVHIGICHDDNAVVTQFGNIEIIIQTAADCGDHGLDFLVFQHFVLAGLFYVQKFTANRKDCLKETVASLFCGTACRITLDDIEFADGRIFAGTVGEFTGKREPFECAFALNQFACFACSFPGIGGDDGFADNVFGNLRILFQKRTESFVDHGVHDPFDFVVAELGFGL